MVFAPPLPGPETRDMAFNFDELYCKTLGEMAEFLDSGQPEFITVEYLLGVSTEYNTRIHA